MLKLTKEKLSYHGNLKNVHISGALWIVHSILGKIASELLIRNSYGVFSCIFLLQTWWNTVKKKL